MSVTAPLRALLRRRGGSIATPPPLGPDEARFTLDNGTAKFTPREPLKPHYPEEPAP